MDSTTFVKPTLDYFHLWPILVVLGVAALGVVVEAFVPRARRFATQTVLALAGLAAALVGTVLVGLDLTEVGDGAARGLLTAGGTLVIDGPAVFLWGWS